MAPDKDVDTSNSRNAICDSPQWRQIRFPPPGTFFGYPSTNADSFSGHDGLWDPVLVNSLAEHRPLILMDYAGTGFSTGRVASTVADSADDVIHFLQALGEPEVDILGFSIGGYIAPMVALNAPDDVKVRKLVISSTGASAGPDTIPSPHKDITQLVGGPDVTFDDYATLFFPKTVHGTAAMDSWWTRIYERSTSTSGEERSNIVSFNYTDGGAGLSAQSHLFAAFGLVNETRGRNGSYDRLPKLKTPVLITNGHVRNYPPSAIKMLTIILQNDYLIPTQNSFTLQQILPNAQLILYPDSGHGHLFQYANLFAQQVLHFLQSY